ncbi:MAG TPA: STAS domain-containing protein [Nitrospirota bacterium]|nr:STAS domain-containing protein [Nitrospirota bacterium]
MNVEISSEKITAGFLLTLKGDVDMNTSPSVRSSLADLFQQGSPEMRALLINLSHVRYMDSSGIATLVECLQNCMKKGARLRLCALSPTVRDVFELARLSSVFEIFTTVDDAQMSL